MHCISGYLMHNSYVYVNWSMNGMTMGLQLSTMVDSYKIKYLT